LGCSSCVATVAGMYRHVMLILEWGYKRG